MPHMHNCMQKIEKNILNKCKHLTVLCKRGWSSNDEILNNRAVEQSGLTEKEQENQLLLQRRCKWKIWSKNKRPLAHKLKHLQLENHLGEPMDHFCLSQ